MMRTTRTTRGDDLRSGASHLAEQTRALRGHGRGRRRGSRGVLLRSGHGGSGTVLRGSRSRGSGGGARRGAGGGSAAG